MWAVSVDAPHIKRSAARHNHRGRALTTLEWSVTPDLAPAVIKKPAQKATCGKTYDPDSCKDRFHGK